MSARLLLSLFLALVAGAVCASAASARLIGFQTPNEKVGCYVSGDGARCDVRRPRWQAPPPPADCELDYGQGVVVGRKGPAEYVCAGDTTLDPGHDVLRRGEKVKAGRFRCKNTGQNTIKCVNRRTRAGFLVSRRSVRFLGG
jgi:hypothetical protein